MCKSSVFVPNMAAGHILPGYGNLMTRSQRVLSAGRYPLDSATLKECEKAACLSQQEFSQIKENARQLWSQQCPRMTTYETYFSNGEIREITQPRPTSRDRHNNPHPTQLFITNKLHFIEGFQKPNRTVRKSIYQVDAGVNSPAKRQARPGSALTSQYKDPYGFRNILPPLEAQAAEAWVKLADDVDHYRVMEVLKEQGDVLKLNNNTMRPKSAYPSLNKQMKMCGAEENEAISGVMHIPSTHSGMKYQSCGKEPQPGRSQNKRESRTNNVCVPAALRRGEYSIHPDWPTSLSHHRVP